MDCYDIIRYVEDLALWGVNTLMAIYPIIHLTGWHNPESEPALEQMRKLLGAAKSAGLATATDTPPQGEWQGLTDALARDGSWADYILADAHEDLPRYPLDTGVPGHLPLINFPEISMWGNAKR